MVEQGRAGVRVSRQPQALGPRDELVDRLDSTGCGLVPHRFLFLLASE
jgi:hypothetical protein